MNKVIILKFACDEKDVAYYTNELVDNNPIVQEIPYILCMDIKDPSKQDLQAIKEIDAQNENS